MATQDFNDTQIEMLRRRWQEEPSVHVSLQLADLYRQKGEAAQAVQTIEKSLEANPDRVSVKVALGRYRLEADDAAGAAEVLEEVADADASHLVANKLLVRAYLALDDRKRASDRLDLYAVLNDGDPELSTMRAALAGTPAEPAVAVQRPGDAPFAQSLPPMEMDLASVAPPKASSPRSLSGALDQSPFSELIASPIEAAPVASLFGMAAAEEVAPEPEAVPEAEAEIEIEEIPLAQEPPAWAADQPEPAVAAVEEDEAPAPEEIETGAAATATLGSLYFAQGHLEEAEATFTQVLARDPDDLEAQAGLELIAQRRVAEAGHAPVEAHGDPDRRVRVLKDYLGRIRSAADRLSA